MPKKPEISMDIFLFQIDKIMDEFGIIDEKGNRDDRKFDEMMGWQNNLYRWRDGRVKGISLQKLLEISLKFNKSLDWLVLGKESKPVQALQPIITIAGTQPEIPADVRAEDYLAVPLVEGLVGAGYEGAVPWEYVDHLIYIYRPELGRRQHHKLRAIRVAGAADSMMPTIRPRDIVIIDPEERPPQRSLDKKAIYAVRLDDQGNAALKRVREVEDYWICLSDNLNHNPILIKKTDVPNLIIGRVIWSWTGWAR